MGNIKSNSVAKGIIYIILTALCFSMQEISGSALSSDLNAFQVNATSYFIGALLFLPLAFRQIKKNNLKLGSKQYLYFLLLGAIQVSVGMTLLQESLYFISPDIVAILVCSNTIMTVPLARIINKEPFDMKAWIPIILAAIGIVIIFNPFGDAASTTQVTSRHIIGVAIGLLGALCLALFNVLATRSVKKYGKEVTNSFSFLYGTILMYIFMIIFGVPVFKHLVPVLSSVQTSILGVAGLGQAQIHNIGAFITAHNHDVYRNYVILLFIAVIVKFFGFLFFVGAMKEVGAINATSVFYIKPILVPIFAFLILGTVIQPTTIIGIAVIVVAAVLLYFIKRSTAKRLQAQNGNNSH